MNVKLLKQHISQYLKWMDTLSKEEKDEFASRDDRAKYYQSWTKDLILKMTEEEIYEYISKLWGMLIWKNKRYVVDKLIKDNGFENVKRNLSELIWGNAPIEKRWDKFREIIKGMGPAMISEILCHAHPTKFMIWNRRAYVGLNYLGVKNLPRYDYQINGKKYSELTAICHTIVSELKKAGKKEANLLQADYFIWHELQVEQKLSRIHKKEKESITSTEARNQEFIHDDIRDKIAEIGEWLGFSSEVEKKVAEGSRVDTVWEYIIGNIGRIVYVFEVQTKGSIDSLIMNLLKALNNQAVQCVVAVSDVEQLEKIKRHASEVGDLQKKIKYWNYEEVLQIHEKLERVHDTIKRLGLVPHGF